MNPFADTNLERDNIKKECAQEKSVEDIPHVLDKLADGLDDTQGFWSKLLGNDGAPEKIEEEILDLEQGGGTLEQEPEVFDQPDVFDGPGIFEKLFDTVEREESLSKPTPREPQVQDAAHDNSEGPNFFHNLFSVFDKKEKVHVTRENMMEADVSDISTPVFSPEVTQQLTPEFSSAEGSKQSPLGQILNFVNFPEPRQRVQGSKRKFQEEEKLERSQIQQGASSSSSPGLLKRVTSAAPSTDPSCIVISEPTSHQDVATDYLKAPEFEDEILSNVANFASSGSFGSSEPLRLPEVVDDGRTSVSSIEELIARIGDDVTNTDNKNKDDGEKRSCQMIWNKNGRKRMDHTISSFEGKGPHKFYTGAHDIISAPKSTVEEKHFIKFVPKTPKSMQNFKNNIPKSLNCSSSSYRNYFVIRLSIARM